MRFQTYMNLELRTDEELQNVGLCYTLYTPIHGAPDTMTIPETLAPMGYPHYRSATPLSVVVKGKHKLACHNPNGHFRK